MEYERDLSSDKYSEALKVLIDLGLVDVVSSGGREAYRLSKTLDNADFTPNAALRARIEEEPALCEDSGA